MRIQFTVTDEELEILTKKAIEGGSQYLWMEEEKSLELKMDLIRQNDLGGVGCWKLGFEPASVWDIVTYE